MISRKFAYADDLALLHSSGNWKDMEGTLSQDMSTLSAYLQIAHVSSPFSGIAQKTILARHTAEATRGLGMGCWC